MGSIRARLTVTYAAALLMEHAQWSVEREGDWRALAAARRWCARDLAPLIHPDASHRAESALLIMPRAEAPEASAVAPEPVDEPARA